MATVVMVSFMLQMTTVAVTWLPKIQGRMAM